MDKPNLFNFQNPNDYVYQVFLYCKSKNPKLSIRGWARQLEAYNPSNLLNIIHGRRKISGAIAMKIANIMDLSLDEKNYLQLLIDLSKTRDIKKRAGFLDEIKKENLKHLKQGLDLKGFELIQDWFPLALLEATYLKEISQVSNNKIAEMFYQNLSPMQVETAFQRLIKLGLIKVNKQGIKERNEDTPLQIGKDVPSEAIREYHRQSLELAQLALVKNGLDERYFTTLNVAIQKKDIPKIIKAINRFNDEILSLSSKDKANLVYRLNVQGFNLTKSPQH